MCLLFFERQSDEEVEIQKTTYSVHWGTSQRAAIVRENQSKAMRLEPNLGLPHK